MSDKISLVLSNHIITLLHNIPLQLSSFAPSIFTVATKSKIFVMCNLRKTRELQGVILLVFKYRFKLDVLFYTKNNASYEKKELS